MRNKLLIIGAIALVLFYLKKKKDQEKEDKKIEEALKANELTAKEVIDIIRLKFNEYLMWDNSMLSEEERDNRILWLTTGLEDYKAQFLHQ